MGGHSEKPEISLELIEAYFPTLPKIELNRRGQARPGWDAWGLEAETSSDDEPDAVDGRSAQTIEDALIATGLVSNSYCSISIAA